MAEYIETMLHEDDFMLLIQFPCVRQTLELLRSVANSRLNAYAPENAQYLVFLL